MPAAVNRSCMPLAQEMCQGRGLEIGAASYSDFGVDAWNLDLTPEPLPAYRTEQMRHAGSVSPIHIVGLGETLPIGSNSQDFLLASHVLEHSPDPIGTLVEWDRVIRPGGVLFLIIPHKERTPDRVRPRTTLAHVVEDFYTKQTPATHRETDGFLTPPALHTPHYHAWITVDFLEIVVWMIEQGLVTWCLEEIEDIDSDRQSGFTFVLRKQAEPLPRDLAGTWVSRRALRSMLRCPEQLGLLKSKGLIADHDLFEVLAGSVIWQDILIQERERIIKAHKWEISELRRDLDGVRAWAGEMEARLRVVADQAVYVPAFEGLRARFTKLRRARTPDASMLQAPPATPRDTDPEQVSSAPPPLDEAHFDHFVAERQSRMYQAARRWGSYEVELTAIELLDGQGRVVPDIRSGEPLTVRMQYLAHQPILDPVFGIAIHYLGGIQVLGINTAFSKMTVPQIAGQGLVECSFESLPLLAGQYSISCSVYDSALAHAYDHQHFVAPFAVIGDHAVEQYGLVVLPHRWLVQQASAAAETTGVAL